MKTNATLKKVNRNLFIYLVIALLILGISEQSLLLGQNCSTEQISLTHLDQSALENCSPENNPLICVRVKFHYLNNSEAISESEDDKYYYDLFLKLNEVFIKGNIKLSFDYNCIHREDLTSSLSELIVTNNEISYLLQSTDQSIIDQLEFDENSINIYTLQAFPENVFFGSHTGKHVVVPVNNFPLLVHEIGHSLGLRHTFTGSGLGDPENYTPLDGHCKDASVISPLPPYNLLCTEVDDWICDTPIDTWTLDIDEDEMEDRTIWLDGCSQSSDLLNTYVDACEDDVTPWNIPIKNFMSYYGDCRTEFTPCQYGRIYEMMIEKPELLLNPENDPYVLCTAPDITINSVTTYSSMIEEYCPGQKIIITPYGYLFLNGTTLTASDLIGPNSVCPDLGGNLWDGIFTEGRGNTITYNGKIITLGGLSMTNVSIISHSKYGIEGLEGYGSVEIINSKFLNNYQVLNLRDPWPFNIATEGIVEIEDFTNGPELCGYSIYNPYPQVIIQDSEMELRQEGIDPLPMYQIKIDGGSLDFVNSDITNPNALSNYIEQQKTAIKLARGRLLISNGSHIENFNTGVFKANDIYNNCSPRGLLFYRSSTINCDVSIHTTTQFANVKDSYLSGDPVIEGFSYSSWNCNRILPGPNSINAGNLGMISLNSPEKSCNFKNNCLINCGFNIKGSNESSYLTCNTWIDNDETAVFADFGSSLPESWGGGLTEISSGNKFTDQVSPYLISEEEEILNFFNINDPQENWNYLPLFEGVQALVIVDCGETCCPLDPPDFSSSYPNESINYVTVNQNWLSLDSIKQIRINSLTSATGEYAKRLAEEIEIINNKKEEITRRVLSTLSVSNETIESTWLSRSEPKLLDLSNLIALFYGRDFDEISNNLNSNNDDDAIVLMDGVEYISNLKTRDILMYSIPESELDTLISIATSSYGDYTNILRDFINMAYDVDLSWPKNEFEPRSVPISSETESKSFNNKFTISPNPSNQCFKITGPDPNNIIEVRVYDFLGKIVIPQVSQIKSEICIPNGITGTFILNILYSNGKESETHKIIIN